MLQNRFVKERRLRGISGIDLANDVLEGGFLEDLNCRITVPAIAPEDAQVKVDKKMDLRTIFCFEKTRMVGND